MLDAIFSRMTLNYALFPVRLLKPRIKFDKNLAIKQRVDLEFIQFLSRSEIKIT